MSKPPFPDGYKFEGFEAPHYTPVPDVVFDYFLARLTGAELKVLFYIIRRTLGFKKNSDNISLDQMVNGITTKNGRVLDEGTGLSKPSVTKAVQSLVDRGIIIAQRNQSSEKGDEPTTYTLNFKAAPVLKNFTRGGQKSLQGGVKKPNTQQTVIQETESQETESRLQTVDESRESLGIKQQHRLCESKEPSPDESQPVVVALTVLTQKGIHKRTAQRLIRDFPTDRILEKIETHDWLLEHNPQQLERNPAGWLIKAIEDDYSPPQGFKTQKQRQAEIAKINRQQEEMLEAQEAYRREHNPKEQAKARYGIDEETMRTWERALAWLENEMAKETFDNLLQSSLLLSIKDGTATVGVRNQRAKEWLEHRLAKVVQRTLSEALGQQVEIKFEVLE